MLWNMAEVDGATNLIDEMKIVQAPVRTLSQKQPDIRR